MTFVLEKYGSKQETYIYESGKDAKLPIQEKQTSTSGSAKSLRNFFESAFLPQGYPDSVSEDYFEYQVWDTAQAFCSSITGMLATQAMLKGYGVGDESATVLAASLTWMLKDGAGMMGRILFAWLKGTQLDCDAKRWRLFADILNDAAIFLDLLAPLFKRHFIFIACLSSIGRSIVGVAGGATRAALTLHQARRDNMADVSAKDGSQETLVNLMALVAGFILTPLVAEKLLFVWTLFCVFTFFHLYSNYRAVSCVVMETVNMPRLYILLTNYLKTKIVLSPRDVSKKDPVIRRAGFKHEIRLGSRLTCVLESYNGEERTKCIEHSEKRTYLLGLNKGTISIALQKSCTNEYMVRACLHALLMDLLLQHQPKNGLFHKEYEEPLDQLKEEIGSKCTQVSWDLTLKLDRFVETICKDFIDGLNNKGWDLKRCHLGPDEWRYQCKDKSL